VLPLGTRLTTHGDVIDIYIYYYKSIDLFRQDIYSLPSPPFPGNQTIGPKGAIYLAFIWCFLVSNLSNCSLTATYFVSVGIVIVVVNVFLFGPNQNQNQIITLYKNKTRLSLVQEENLEPESHSRQIPSHAHPHSTSFLFPKSLPSKAIHEDLAENGDDCF
jgi:hypothetical protein